ncbi:TetR/AcrR family transcriptional regulator [Aquamicrobium terrae]|uniref:AcrR family transcriptional regulator n=1 Tax=Aquamicrobium terrae TaxID=1324945 RepID=A0ABV2N6P5_9HYPH
MARRNTLQPKDWIIGATRALAAGGVDAVSVEGIAKQLGASKGSFYWHFADRPALLEAVFDLWEREGTADLIERAEAVADPAEGLRVLARDTLDAETNGIDVARTEAAIRAWASRDPAIGRRFARIEDNRTAFLAQQIRALGYDEVTALRLSKVVHLAVVGLFAARASGSALAEDETLTFMVEWLIADAPGKGRRK